MATLLLFAVICEFLFFITAIVIEKTIVLDIIYIINGIILVLGIIGLVISQTVDINKRKLANTFRKF